MRAISVLFLIMFSWGSFAQDCSNYPVATYDSIRMLNFEKLKAADLCKISYNNLQREANLHKIRLLRHSESRYHWHGIASTIIFIVVISIVISGLVFSAIQFGKSFQKVKSVEHTSGQGKTVDAETQKISITLSGIEVTSSVLGVVILVVSIAFFYLYLVKVYPLDAVEMKDLQSVQGAVDSSRKK